MLRRQQPTWASSEARYEDVALILATRLSVIAFIVIVAAFHVLRPDVNPVTRGISRYQWGPHGTAMSVGFGLLGLALLGAARVIQGWQLQDRFPSNLLQVSALGSLLVAAFPLPESPPPVRAAAHQLGGFVLFGAAALAATRITPADDGRAVVRLLGRLTTASVVLFFLVILVKVPVVGLLQRLVLVAMSAWIATITRTMAHPRRQAELK